jgi:hypothetical protein
VLRIAHSELELQPLPTSQGLERGSPTPMLSPFLTDALGLCETELPDSFDTWGLR